MKKNYNEQTNDILNDFTFIDKNTKREVLCILLNLRESNRTSSEKSKLVSIYLDNRNEVNKQKLKSLICNSLVLSTYTYIEQLSIINSFIEDNSIYKDTMEKCYIMALEI